MTNSLKHLYEALQRNNLDKKTTEELNSPSTKIACSIVYEYMVEAL